MSEFLNMKKVCVVLIVIGLDIINVRNIDMFVIIIIDLGFLVDIVIWGFVFFI